MMSKRIAYGPVHSASFCTERRGVKVWQKIPLGSQLLFCHEMSGLPLICFKDKAKAKLVPVIHSLKASRPGRYRSVTAGLLYIPEHDSSPGLASGLWQSHTKASRDEIKAKRPTTLS